MKNSKFSMKLSAILIALALLVAAFPTGILSVSAFAAEQNIKFGVVSDIHYYCSDYFPETITPEFDEFAIGGQKHYINQKGIINSMLAFYKKQAADGNLDCVIIPGDVTRNGEYYGNVELASILEAFENETGVPVLVINGNHDINNSDAASFANGVSPVDAKRTSPEEFREIYKNLGYDLAVSTYTPPKGEKAGMLSYSVSLNGYRFILIDGGRYSPENTEKKKYEHETAGNYTEGVKEWALNQIKEAKECGETPIGVDHWSLVPHYDSQAYVLQGFALDDYLEVSEAFADAGLHYMFTGHSHSCDVAQHINDNGEVIWDIQTNSVIEFPHTIRTVEFTTSGDDVSFNYKTHDVDEVLPVESFDGTFYDQPYRKSFSFAYSYCEDAAEYAKRLVKSLLGGLFADITAEGGLAAYLDNRLDLEGLIASYVGPLSKNAMAFIDDLGAQIDELYIKDPSHTFDVLNSLIDQLADSQLSEYQCKALYDEYGWVGSEKGTFGDLALAALVSMAEGDEVMDDPFILDVVDQFENGDLGEKAFNKVYDLIVTQLVEDEILPNLKVNLGSLTDPTSFAEAGDYINAAISIIVGILNVDLTPAQTASVAGDIRAISKTTSFLDLVNAVLKVLDVTGVLEGGSIDGVIDALLSEYITDSQYQAWGHTISYLVSDLCDDTNPAVKADKNGSLDYTGKLPVEATVENYRMPALISNTVCGDAATERTVSWYTKYSLDATDIEIIPYTDSPVFTGKTAVPAGVTVEASSELKNRQFPGVDLGIIGILPFELHLQRHVVNIKGLESGAKYLYRVGNAEYGWWSEVGTIRTADNGDSFSFLHFTDSQGQNEKQYEIVSNVLDKAFEFYPDAELMIHSGDVVDKGDNVNYWRYFFNCSEKLLDIPVMAVAGNHEAKGDYALVDNFVLPESVEQDTLTGYYYSFDYNNVHYIMLNTNDTTNDGLSDEQIEWLKKDAYSSDADWKIVVLHKAVYSNGSHFDDKDVVAMREQFADLMPELGIDMVFQGHDHVYLRTDPMKGNEIVDVKITSTEYEATEYSVMNDPQGTVYAITGASGCKNYIAKSESETDELFPRAKVTYNADKPVFAGVRIEGSTLYYDAYTVDGDSVTKIDSFAITKTAVSGDVDNDGEVTNEDVRHVLRLAVGLEDVSGRDEFVRCDMDHDNHITVIDARIILNKLAGIE